MLKSCYVLMKKKGWGFFNQEDFIKFSSGCHFIITEKDYENFSESSGKILNLRAP